MEKSVADVIAEFEATQVAFVEKRDGETGVSTMDPRVVGRVIALMGITLAERSGSWERFLKRIESFQTNNL